MRLIRHLQACPAEYKGACIALGNFDGVHLGHQAILRECIIIAKAKGIPAAVMTFEPHPREFFARQDEKLRLYSLHDKLELLRDMGIEAVFLARFTRDFAALTPEAFVHEVLGRQLAARHVVTGYNFAFGSKRRGNTAFLADIAAASGFGFSACPPVHDGAGEAVSSSAIRRLLAEGEPGKAAALLGRPYHIGGHVRHGDRRGRLLGMPTANIALDDLFKPRFGVYAARVALENEAAWHDAVASIGVKPTFGQSAPLLEAHVFAMNRDMYGKRIQVELAGFIRDEQTFGTAEALCAQMEDDCGRAKAMLKERA